MAEYARRAGEHSGEINLANSGSYARGDQPRSVPDPDAAAHAAAAKAQRAYNERQAAEEDARRKAQLLGDRIFPLVEPRQSAPVEHPGLVESLIPFWGSGKEAKADADEGDVLGALGNSALLALDFIPGATAGKALERGVAKTTGPFVWRTKPWEAQGVRQWLGDVGHLASGQAGHHWAIPQNGWGKAVPDWIKNQPWNIKGLDAVTHGRVHGPYTVNGVKLPQFNALERYWYGTPDWFKAVGVTTPGGVARATDRK